MQTPFKLILLDLDGTLYIGNQEIPGACQTIQFLRERGYQLCFLTNTTTKTQSQLVAHLRQLGFVLADRELISAPEAARIELRKIQSQFKRPLRIWPVVADAIKNDFTEFLFDQEQPDYIVLGDIGDQWNLELINRLFQLIHSGSELIALHKNRFWQTDSGLKADIGFFVAGLEYVTNKNALIMGKPNSDFFKSVLNFAGVTAAETLLVGDDIESDVGGAQAVGIQGCLVRTGKFRPQQLELSLIKPDFVISSISELSKVIN